MSREGVHSRASVLRSLFVIIPSPRSFWSPLPFRFFQRMVEGGRVVEDESPAGAKETNSEPGRKEPVIWSNRLPWIEGGSRELSV